MPRKVHLTPTTSAIPDLLARQIAALVRETAEVVGVGGANPFEVELLLLDFVIEHLTDRRAALRETIKANEEGEFDEGSS
jgi:hypothetical protein